MPTETATVDDLKHGSADEWGKLNERLTEDFAKLPEVVRDREEAKPAESPEEGGSRATTDEKQDGQETDSTTESGSGTPPATSDKQKPADNQNQQPQPQQKPPELSKFEKAKQREAEAWKKINETKAENERVRAAFEQRERDLYAREQALIHYQRAKPQQQQPEFTPEQYEAEANKLESEGKFDLAEIAREEAKRIRVELQQRPAQQQAQPQQDYIIPPEIVAEQNKWWNQAKQELPDLVQAGTELNKTTIAILKSNPELLHFPRGPYLVAKHAAMELEVGKFRKEAGRVPELEKEVESLKSKINELQKLTSVGPGSNGSAPVAQKPFEDMTLAEQDAEIRKMIAAEA